MSVQRDRQIGRVGTLRLIRRAAGTVVTALHGLVRAGLPADENRADTLLALLCGAQLLKADSSNRRTPDHSADDADALQRIHLAVRAVLRHRGAVAVPNRQLTLHFDHGIIARCSRCWVMWRVSRVHYRTLSWWCCPSGCGHQRDGAV